MKRSVLVIMDSLRGGGAEKALIALLRQLAPHYDITLLLFNASGTWLRLVPSPVKVVEVYRGHKPWLHRAIFHTPLRDTAMRKKLRKLLGDKNFDVALSFLEGAAAWLHSLLPGDMAGRHLSWVHTDFTHNHWSRAFFKTEASEQAFYDRMDRVIFASHDARRRFTYKLEDNRAAVIHNIIDVDEVKRLAREREVTAPAFTVCYVGRLHPIKRPDRFVDMVALLRERGLDVHAWILGEGEMHYALTEQCRRLQLDRDVELLGFQENPYPFLAAASALVISSDAEGLSLVMLEAMALGTPTVATQCAGPTEVLAGGGGRLARFDAASLAQAVLEVHDNPAAFTPRELPAQFTAKHITAQLRAALDA